MFSTSFLSKWDWRLSHCVAWYRVFINECNEALDYNFGQMASHDLGHVAKVSYIYDILIFNFENNFIKIEVCGQYVQFSNIGENTKKNLTNFPD